jgi:hypothetical protein
MICKKVLISFHVGSETRHFESLFGIDGINLDFHFLEVQPVKEGLESVGFVCDVEIVRNNYPEEVATRRAYLQFRKL